jgi:hypothetical protein
MPIFQERVNPSWNDLSSDKPLKGSIHFITIFMQETKQEFSFLCSILPKKLAAKGKLCPKGWRDAFALIAPVALYTPDQP